MAALAKHESEPELFVGQVLARSSPILTWRPVLAVKSAREAVEEARDEEVSAEELLEAPESSIYRVSRAPTRRMVALPVISRVQHERPRTGWMIARGVVIAVAAVGILSAVGAAVYAWQTAGIAQIAPPTAKVVAVHTLDEGLDSIVRPAAAVAVAPQVAAPAPKPAAHPAVRGRAHHGHRPTNHATANR